MLIGVAGHEVAGIDNILFGNLDVTFNNAGDIADSFPYVDVAKAQFFTGADNQTVAPDLAADTTLIVNGRWLHSGGAFNDQLHGIATLYVRLEYDDVYSEGIPDISVIVRGVKVYDPRLDSTEGGSGSHRKDDPSTWAWSANPALIAGWYLTFTKMRGGYGLPWSKIDISAMAEAANVCDENVGGAVRYACNGVVDTSMSPAMILAQITASMAGNIIWPEGIAVIQAGELRTPLVTIDEDDLLSDITFLTARPIQDSFNEVGGTYASPVDRYAIVDTPTIRDERRLDILDFVAVDSAVEFAAAHGLVDGDRIQLRPDGVGLMLPSGLETSIWYYVKVVNSTIVELALELDGASVAFSGSATGFWAAWHDVGLSIDGVRQSKSIKLDLVASNAQAQRLCQIELRRNREPLAVTLQCSIEALALLPGDTVRVLNQRYGWMEAIASTQQAFTANTSTDRLTATAHGLNDGDAIWLLTSGTLPAPLAVATKYYVRDKDTDTYRVTLRRNGPAIDITTTGSGTHLHERIQGRLFEVDQLEMELAGDPPAPVVTLSLQSTSAAVWDDYSVITVATPSQLNLPSPISDQTRRILAPVITWVDPPTDPYDFSSSGSFDLEFDVTDSNGDLIAIRADLLNAITGALVTTIVNETFPRTTLRNFTQATNTHGVGTYRIVITATDEAGNVTTATRTVINASGPTPLLPPTFDPLLADFSTSIDIDIDILSGSGDRIQWATTAVGGAEPTTGITTVVATSTTVNLTSSRRLWARSGDGVDVSAWVFSDYFRVGSL
jgi:hypothetical protein